MSRRFAPNHDFIEIHDLVAIIGKWASSGSIYLGCSSVSSARNPRQIER
jgi:hypothetical protein